MSDSTSHDSSPAALRAQQHRFPTHSKAIQQPAYPVEKQIHHQPPLHGAGSLRNALCVFGGKLMQRLFHYPKLIFFKASPILRAAGLQCFLMETFPPSPPHQAAHGGSSLLPAGLGRSWLWCHSAREFCLVDPTRTKAACSRTACAGTCSCQQTRPC